MAIPIDPISNPRIGFEVLPPDAVRRIHEATLEVVETVGVRFPSERALDVWAAHGATVDRETQVVKAPRDLVMAALAHAPASYVLGARDPSQDLPLDGHHVYAATDGCGIEIIDIDTGELRRSVLQDVADISRVADALDEIGFIWTPLSAHDMPPESRSLHELKVQWANTTKHLQTETHRHGPRGDRRHRDGHGRRRERAGPPGEAAALDHAVHDRRRSATTAGASTHRWSPRRPGSRPAS